MTTKSINSRHNPVKTLATFIATIIAVIFGSGSSKAPTVEIQAVSEPTIAERLASVRKHFRIQTGQSIDKPAFFLSPLSNKDEPEGDRPKDPKPPSWNDATK